MGYLRMSVEERQTMGSNAFTAWKRHTEAWLPKLESIGYRATQIEDNDANIKRRPRRLKISYHTQSSVDGKSLALCPADLYVMSGGCRTGYGLNVNYPDKNAWMCKSLAEEHVVATAVCTNLETDAQFLQKRDWVQGRCPLNKFRPQGRTLIGGVGCHAGNSSIQAIGIESHRHAVCGGQGSTKSLYVSCFDTRHPFSKVSIISGPDAVAWCASHEVAVAGGCQALHPPFTVLTSEPVNACNRDVTMDTSEKLPAVCSGWRCESAGASAQVVTALCMVSTDTHSKYY